MSIISCDKEWTVYSISSIRSIIEFAYMIEDGAKFGIFDPLPHLRNNMNAACSMHSQGIIYKDKDIFVSDVLALNAARCIESLCLRLEGYVGYMREAADTLHNICKVELQSLEDPTPLVLVRQC